jgi:putative Mg2+ transporter-C (MgtC) family protein
VARSAAEHFLINALFVEAIRGLTTAASLWSVAAIGLSVGGLYSAAISTTVLVLVILFGLKMLERRLFASRPLKLSP